MAGYAPVKLLTAAMLAACLSASRVGAQNDPATMGQWSGLISLPIVTIHMQMLPNGKLIAWGNPSVPPTDGKAHVRVWDPLAAELVFEEARNPFVNVYCTGHTLLKDGRLLTIGGHIHSNIGSDATTTFDVSSRRWTNGQRMSAGRWYPSATLLPNGDVLTTSGDIDTTVGVNTLPQVYQAAEGTWRDLTDAQLAMPLYPWMHLAPNGKVFNSGPGQITRYLDTSGTGQWTTVASTNFGDRRQYEGASVMYEPGKVIIIGGGRPASATAEVIDLNDANPQWRFTKPMSFRRRTLNATLLPDGKVLASGGSSAIAFSDPSEAVFNAEIWDPATESWSTMASMSTSRLYHSTAVLLPDGRVFVSGGGGDGPDGDIDHYDAEYFSPPYLFKGPRPAIDLAPARAAYAEPFTITATDTAGVRDVTLVAVSGTTHEHNMSQRFLRLAFAPTAEPNRFSVTAPDNPNVAPPGYYMLFVLNANGVPSVAKMLRLEASVVSNKAPVVQAGPSQTITLPSAANLTGSASDDGRPQPLTTTWSQVSGPGTVTFADPGALTTSASFPAPGVYVLSLRASDGAAASSDNVTVTVKLPPNKAPVVGAGADRAITLPAAVNLAGSASDDGLPGPLTITWSKVSGPGTVAFDDASALSTGASFSAPGVYVLRLRASDGAAAVSDELTVTVKPAPGTAGGFFGGMGGRISEAIANALSLPAGSGATAAAGGAVGTLQSAPIATNGLTGSYYSGVDFNTLAFTRVDPAVDFTWGPASPGPAVPADAFSVRWSGQVEAPVTGTYTFSTVTNNGSRLFVNGVLVIDGWTAQETTTNTSPGIALEAGVRYPITMEYFGEAQSGLSRLLWAYPGQAQTVIPQSRLSP